MFVTFFCSKSMQYFRQQNTDFPNTLYQCRKQTFNNSLYCIDFLNAKRSKTKSHTISNIHTYFVSRPTLKSSIIQQDDFNFETYFQCIYTYIMNVIKYMNALDPIPLLSRTRTEPRRGSRDALINQPSRNVIFIFNSAYAFIYI